MPRWPPKARPASISSRVMPVSRSVVLNTLLMGVASVFLVQSIRCTAHGAGLGGCRRQLPSCARLGRARAPVPTRAGYSNTESALTLPLQRSVEGLVEGCFGFFVIRRGDLALFFFYFELEHFFFQRFEQHRRFCDRS